MKNILPPQAITPPDDSSEKTTGEMIIKLDNTSMKAPKLDPILFRKYQTPITFWQVVGIRFIPMPKEDISQVIVNIYDYLNDGEYSITRGGPASIVCHITPLNTGLNPEIWQAESGTIKFRLNRTPGKTHIVAEFKDCVVVSDKNPKASFWLAGKCEAQDALTYP
ncbi:hypothetical protein DYL59_20785 [Pseudomonas kairouanensis]|uniref:Uncharacterized protein n=1 Tax=Pseudomonas kairouanensis TaxID=2293832 RepID=A0A4Z0AK71_9PSED|nr:hypothetical protein [Pseudomonas kairouanensis]TFY86807.1 hypothetical protein DYL59_20785 [Pseudomonas kairouanensis]